MLLTREQTAVVVHAERMVSSRTKKNDWRISVALYHEWSCGWPTSFFPSQTSVLCWCKFGSLLKSGKFWRLGWTKLYFLSLDNFRQLTWQVLPSAQWEMFSFFRLLWTQWRTSWTEHRWNCSISRTLSRAMKGWLKPTRHRWVSEPSVHAWKCFLLPLWLIL